MSNKSTVRAFAVLVMVVSLLAPGAALLAAEPGTLVVPEKPAPIPDAAAAAPVVVRAAPKSHRFTLAEKMAAVEARKKKLAEIEARKAGIPTPANQTGK